MALYKTVINSDKCTNWREDNFENPVQLNALYIKKPESTQRAHKVAEWPKIHAVTVFPKQSYADNFTSSNSINSTKYAKTAKPKIDGNI